jgi:hypothetical protein
VLLNSAELLVTLACFHQTGHVLDNRLSFSVHLRLLGSLISSSQLDFCLPFRVTSEPLSKPRAVMEVQYDAAVSF